MIASRPESSSPGKSQEVGPGWRSRTRPSLARSWPELLGLALLVVVVVVHAATLPHYPAVWDDEASQSSRAWSLATGDPELNVHWLSDGPAPERDNGLYGLTLRSAFRLFGPDYVVGRTVSLGWGLLLLLNTYLLGRLLITPRAALFAVLALALSWPFLFSSHLIRPDIALAALGLGALLFQQLAYRRGWWWPHLLVGPLLVIGYEVHQNVVAFALGIGLVYLLQSGRRVLTSREPWLFVVGLGGALSVHLAASHLAGAGAELISPKAQFLLATTKLPPVLAFSPLEMLAAEALRYLTFQQLASPIELLLWIPTLVWTLGHRETRDRPPLVLAGAVGVTLLLLARNKAPYYLILLYPFVCVLFASTLWGMAHAQRRINPLYVFAALAGCWIVLSGFWRGAVNLPPHLGYDYHQVMQPLREALPPGAAVVAEPRYWLALPDHPYVSSWSLSWEYQQHGRQPREVMAELKPDYVLLNPSFAAFFGEASQGEHRLAGTLWERVLDAEPEFPLPGRPEDLLGPDARVEAQIELPFHQEVRVIRAGWR